MILPHSKPELVAEPLKWLVVSGMRTSLSLEELAIT